MLVQLYDDRRNMVGRSTHYYYKRYHIAASICVTLIDVGPLAWEYNYRLTLNLNLNDKQINRFSPSVQSAAAQRAPCNVNIHANYASKQALGSVDVYVCRNSQLGQKP